MQTPSVTPARADACTNLGPAITQAGIQHVVSQCGDFVTLGYIVTALGGHPKTMTRAMELKVRNWLDEAGWELVMKMVGGMRVWGYARPSTEALMSTSRKQVLLAATVLTPKAGQLLLPMPLIQPYSSSPCILLIDLEALSRNLALALASSDNSLKIASTSELLSELSTALESAMEVCKRSKAEIASWSESGGKSSVLNSSRLTSKAWDVPTDSVSSIDFPKLLTKHSDGNAELGTHSAGGAA